MEDYYTSSKEFSAFLGVMPVLDRTFLVFCHEVVPNITIDKADVFAVGTSVFIPLHVSKIEIIQKLE